MALHTPTVRKPTATPHIPAWMLGAVALLAVVLTVGLVVISRPSAAPTSSTEQTVAITQSNAATQAYTQFRSGERDALNAPELASQAYLAYRAGEQLSSAERAVLANGAGQAADQAFRAGERVGPAEEAQAAFQAWRNYRQGER